MTTVADFQSWMTAFAASVHEHADELTTLDSAIGDADHGSNMDRGMKAVAGLFDDQQFDTIDALCKKVGMTLVSTVGGASGPLYGTFFLRLGAAVQGKSELDTSELGAALRAGVEGVVTRGKAELGDKTMIDAWLPALDAYDAAGDDTATALRAAADAAAQGRDDTVPLVARKGRASYLGERSKDHQDPGATSTALLLETAASTLA